MKVLLVFAHPDDETFATGGTIAKLTKKGVDVTLICATKGEAGQVGNPPVCTQEELPQVREKELQTAAKILGIRKIHFLGFIDGSLHTVSQRKLIDIILPSMQKENPDIVITFNKEGGSKHLDHIQMSRVATKAFALYAKTVTKHVRLYYTATPQALIKKIEQEGLAHYPFGRYKGTPQANISTTVAISDVLEQKLQAFQAHKSQHQDAERFLKRQKFDEFQYEFFRLVYENTIA